VRWALVILKNVSGARANAAPAQEAPPSDTCRRWSPWWSPTGNGHLTREGLLPEMATQFNQADLGGSDEIQTLVRQVMEHCQTRRWLISFSTTAKC